MKNKYLLCFLFLWHCYSCTLEPRIAIPQELKQELVRTGHYNSYVRLLNQSLDSNNVEDLGGKKRNVLLGDAGERAWKCDG